jgi:hypothetical protein
MAKFTNSSLADQLESLKAKLPQSPASPSAAPEKKLDEPITRSNHYRRDELLDQITKLVGRKNFAPALDMLSTLIRQERKPEDLLKYADVSIAAGRQEVLKSLVNNAMGGAKYGFDNSTWAKVAKTAGLEYGPADFAGVQYSNRLDTTQYLTGINSTARRVGPHESHAGEDSKNNASSTKMKSGVKIG